MRALNRILAKHETVYISEMIKEERDVEICIDEREAEEHVQQTVAGLNLNGNSTAQTPAANVATPAAAPETTAAGSN